MALSLNSSFSFIVTAGFLLLAAGCSKKSASETKPQIPTLLNTSKFFIGAAVNSDSLKHDSTYLATVLTEFSAISTLNGLTYDEIEPKQGQYDFGKGAYLVDFHTQKHKFLHARNLIWHKALPGWLSQFKGDSLAWENLFKTHIQTEVAHFKGQIYSWDVVNEAVRDSDGTLRNQDTNADEGSIWRRHLGPDYIARAFQYAHEADPLPLLFYNDYGQELDGVKLDSIISLVTRLKSRGIPISGVGIELHININTNNDGITAALQKLAATGLQVLISELDISVNPDNEPDFVFTDAIKEAQAAKYKFIAQTYMGTVPVAQRFGITTWGASDADSWSVASGKRTDFPLLFDKSYKRKPAYFGIMEGFKY